MALNPFKRNCTKLVKEHLPLKILRNYIYISYKMSIFKEEDSDNIPKSKVDESDSDSELAPVLSVLTNNNSSEVSSSSLKTAAIVPGKGPPPEAPVTCCMSGCANCVYIAYAEELKMYYSDGGEKAREAIEKIEDPSLKAFLKLELDL